MIPIYPFTAYIRQPTFVKEEWDTYFSNGRADNINGGWRGLLYANLALIDPRASYNFFSRPNLDNGLIDPGASLTWYLAYTSSLLQASSSNSVRAAEFDPQINMSAPNDDAVAPVAQVADQSLLQQPVGVAQNSRDAPQGVADNPTPSQGAPQQQQPQPAPGKERRRSQIYKFIKGRFNL